MSADVAVVLDILRRLFPAYGAGQFPSGPELDLSNTDLSGADLSKMDLLDADFRRARLVGASFEEAFLTGANFADADARSTCFQEASLVQASFTAPPILEPVPGGSIEVDPRRRDMIAAAADLRGARFVNAGLDDARLMHVDMRCADLAGASVRGTRFDGADLRGAVLVNVALSDARTRDTRLHGSRDDPAKFSESCVRLLRR